MKRVLKILIQKAIIALCRGPKFIFLLIKKEINNRKKYNLTHEVHKSFGNEFPDKTFYVIGADENWCGLFAIIHHKLMHFEYAIEQGYIPVVDLQNYYNQYLSDYELFKENAWEYFFEQPMGFGLDDINKAKNIIQSVHSNKPLNRQYFGYRDIFDKNIFLKYKNIFTTCVKLNNTSQDFCAKRYAEYLQNKGKVLGILCRGTDFNTLKPKGHPIQPTPDEVIMKAEEVIKKYNCDYIYVATEDADIYDLFVKHFGDRLIIDNTIRWRISDLPNGRSNSKRLSYTDKEGKYKSGMEYLSQIYLLSKCDCFIGGATYGSFGVLMMNENFDYQYIFEKGYY